jgi:S-adenosylmethionine synthetase
MKISYNLKQNISSEPYEIVERKGLGHPDTLADGLAESISIEYSKFTRQEFGAILHHNIDKLGVGGGLWERDFGQGNMIRPVEVMLGGRMSSSFNGRSIDYKDIQQQTTRAYLKKVLPHLDVEKGIKFNHKTSDHSMSPTWYKPRSLEDLPDFKAQWANDTSTVIDHYPNTDTENITQKLENFFYSDEYKPKYNFIGQDIKVMSVRNGKKIDITICVPTISTQVKSIHDYKEIKKQLEVDLMDFAKSILGDEYEICLYINTQDNNPIRPTTYLTATGSCIEFGEEGYVGRGNKANGLISICRPSSMEAPFGKNPVYHTGRVHSYYASQLARKVYQKFETPITAIIQTNNGDPLFSPSNIVFLADKIEDFKDGEKYLDDIVENLFATKKHIDAILEGYLLPKSWV